MIKAVRWTPTSSIWQPGITPGANCRCQHPNLKRSSTVSAHLAQILQHPLSVSPGWKLARGMQTPFGSARALFGSGSSICQVLHPGHAHSAICLCISVPTGVAMLQCLVTIPPPLDPVCLNGNEPFGGGQGVGRSVGRVAGGWWPYAHPLLGTRDQPLAAWGSARWLSSRRSCRDGYCPTSTCAGQG